MPAKARAVRLTPLAQTDLEDIWAYTYERWSLEQAERYTDELVTAFEALARGDKLGRPSRARDSYLRYLVGLHAVFYRETTHTLDVIRVLHQRLDVDRYL
ncbi:type II toxin-antitoxin system RelE/ParE family toxin [Burkholderia ubonensis]|uniref:type II toxin-antitoxin system RelE/ParE family toxin n=1 Tax=Burkholderia ubonensis TaxID=101571 RepID=UPI000754BB64|nr:type II toxin-antitoxin system RelE/ParE family toxin [Burkholderia ubonensis]KWK77701.1 plasmid stabilization protein ParE [Burkholderia ubonensis]